MATSFLGKTCDWVRRIPFLLLQLLRRVALFIFRWIIATPPKKPRSHFKACVIKESDFEEERAFTARRAEWRRCGLKTVVSFKL